MTFQRVAELPALTGLRFIAAISIAFEHVCIGAIFILFGRPIGPVYAMPLFFVLSGFIIHYVYAKSLNERRWGGAALDFMAARISRLYPLFLLILLFYAALGSEMRAVLSASPMITFTYFTMTGSWWYWTIDGHTMGSLTYGWSWSVSTEMFFYVCYALVIFRAYRIRSREVAIASLAALCVASYAVLWVIYQNEYEGFERFLLFFFRNAPAHVPGTAPSADGLVDWFIYQSPYVHILEFVAGVLACQIYILSPAPSRRSTSILFWIGLGSSLAILLTWGSIVTGHLTLQAGQFIHYLHRSFLFGPALSILILACAFGNCAGAKALGWRPVVKLGDASYSIYLGHNLGGAIVGVPIGYPEPLYGTIFSMLFICSFATGLYQLVELPAKNGIRWVYDRVRGRSKAHAPTAALVPAE